MRNIIMLACVYVLGSAGVAAATVDLVAVPLPPLTLPLDTTEASAQMQECATMLNGVRFRNVTTRKQILYYTVANQVARCYVRTPVLGQNTPPSGTGWRPDQWTTVTTGQALTEEQCYAQP